MKGNSCAKSAGKKKKRKADTPLLMIDTSSPGRTEFQLDMVKEGGFLDRPKFLLDGMLGKLARWLRLLGFDAEYKRSQPDDELLELASKEKRVLLTRDTELYRRARKEGLLSIVLEGESNAQDIAKIAAHLELEIRFSTEESRCPKCGGTLSVVPKETTRGKIPSRTYEAYQEFWMCNMCGQIYWQGAHWKNIKQLIEKTNQVLSEKRRTSKTG